MANPDWVKGVSGNPKGRPKDEFAQMVRDTEGLPKELFDLTIKIARGSSGSLSLQAIQFLVERGWGKPIQQVESDSLKELIVKIVNYGDPK